METVTLSLEAWLRRCVPDAELCFEEPGTNRKRVVRICLYDVREEEQSRSGLMYVRDAPNSGAAARMQPLRLLQYSYRLTAHGGNWLDSQRLLGEIMSAGAAAPCLPDDLVHASFSEFGSGALPLVVAPASPVPFPSNTVTSPPFSPALHLMIMAPLRPPADSALPAPPSRVTLATRRTDGYQGSRKSRSVTTPGSRIEEQRT